MTKEINRSFFALILVLFWAINSQLFMAHAQGTAFTYQGRLNNGANAANGSYDFRFRLAADPLANNYVGGNVLTNAVTVSNGLFAVTLDFGAGIFNGSNYWLEVDVRTNNAAVYTALSPLQSLTPAPYAIMANSASNLLGNLSAAQLSGTISGSSLPSSANFTGTLSANNFSGNGAGVSNVNASALGGLTAGNFWQLGGNNVGNGQFLGSTNNQALEVRVNGQRTMLIIPSATDAPNIIGGAPANIVDPGTQGAVIAGGGTTNFLGASSSNRISADFSAIVGGSGNWIQSGADHAFIGSGLGNTVSNASYQSVIAGGQNNSIGATYGVIGGGLDNAVLPASFYSTVAGGFGNIAGGTNAPGYTVSSTVAGGSENFALAAYASIGGGGLNTNFAFGATISGGINNLISTNAGYSFIGGGEQNLILSNADHASIDGGYNNQISGTGSAIAGGSQNVIASGAYYSFIGDGFQNTNYSVSGAIAGGYNNMILPGYYSFIGSGYRNTIQTNCYEATLAGGYLNLIASNAYEAAIGGGGNNSAFGVEATVPGGDNNVAAGTWSFAAGQRAKATNDGAFVWADATAADFTSTNANSFNVRASGGVRFVTSGAGITVDGFPPLISGNGSGITIQNNSDGAPNVIEGSPANMVTPGVVGATISGGGATNYESASLTNSVTGDFGTVSGGAGNLAINWAVVSGGGPNTAGGTFSFVGGGDYNTNMGAYGFIGGGTDNYIQTAYNSFLGGGGGNNILTSSGGYYYSTIVGGLLNTESNAAASFIGGGANNTNYTSFSFIGGGGTNLLYPLARYSFIGAGAGNTVYSNADHSVIGGGFFNFIGNNSLMSVIGGGASNYISLNSYNGTIGGGSNNFVSGVSGTVAGGEGNSASAFRDTVGGGIQNTANGGISTVAGGWSNVANGNSSAILGGDHNQTINLASAIGGGEFNLATNNYATVPGGYKNVAGGAYSFAAGQQALASHQGAFVWADSLGGTFASTATNQFLLRAHGGVGINTASIVENDLCVNTNAYLFSHIMYLRGDTGVDHNHGLAYCGNTVTNFSPNVLPDGPVLWGYGGGALGSANPNNHSVLTWDNIGVSISSTAQSQNSEPELTVTGQRQGNYATPVMYVHNNYPANILAAGPALRVVNDGTSLDGALSVSTSGTGLIAEFGNASTFVVTIGTNGTVVANGVTLTSDRNAKENFTNINAKSILEKVVSLPLSQWNYKIDDAGQKHIGPMAQDFHDAFGLDGADDKHISVVDEGGVALAAIQGLNQKLNERDAEIQELKATNESLEQRLAALETAMKAMTR